MLHPDVILRADGTSIKISESRKSQGAPQFQAEIRGAKNVADTFKGKAAAAQLALVNGMAGATWAPGGKPVVALFFSVREGRISEIDIVMDPQTLGTIDIKILDGYRH